MDHSGSDARPRRGARAAAIVLGYALSGAAVAEEQVRAGKNAADTVELSPVVVTATRVDERAFDLPIAIDTVEKKVIEDQKPMVLISEDLPRVPGTVVTNRGTFAQEEQIMIRGFGARSQFGTRGVKLLADGIPASTPDGQGSPGLFDLGSAQRIEVMRGAFTALYGNHSGGVVQIFTEDGPPEPTLSGRAIAGSYGAWGVGANFGGTTGKANYIADLSHFETDGYRQWSSAQKDQANGKLNYVLDNGARLSLVANYLNQPENLDPLGLTAQQVAADPRQAQPVALQFHTRRSLDNLQGGVVYEQSFSASDSIRAMVYTGTRSNQQYLAIPLSTTSQFAITSAGGVSAFNRDFYGGSLWWNHRMDLLGGPLTVTAGGDYDRANETRKGYLNEFGLQGALKRNEDNSVYSWGGFAQAEWELAPRWSLSAGLRYTDVSFASDDHFICTQTFNTTGTPVGTCSGFLNADGTALRPITTTVNPNDSGSQSYGAWTPVGGLLFRLSPTTNLYASIGRSFETPTLIEIANRPDGGTGLNFTLQPSTSNQYEVGAKMFVGSDTRINADLFYIHTQNEIVVATNQGGRTTFQNAGDTQRKGAELSVDTRLGYGFGGYLALTYLQAEFQNPFLSCNGTPCRTVPPLLNTAPVSAGNKIPGVPPFTAFGELSYAYVPWGFSAAAEVYGQGKVYVNDVNSEAAGEYWIVSLRGGFSQNWRGLRLSEFVRFNNVFDRQYIGAVSVNDANGRFYAPAAGINFLAGVTASYQF